MIPQFSPASYYSEPFPLQYTPSYHQSTPRERRRIVRTYYTTPQESSNVDNTNWYSENHSWFDNRRTSQPAVPRVITPRNDSTAGYLSPYSHNILKAYSPYHMHLAHSSAYGSSPAITSIPSDTHVPQQQQHYAVATALNDHSNTYPQNYSKPSNSQTTQPNLEFTQENADLPSAPVDDNFLVGDLKVTVHCANDLPNMDARKGPLKVFSAIDKTDAYVRISVNGKKGPCTKTINNNLNPVWNEAFEIPLGGEVNVVSFEVKDDDMLSVSEKVGIVELNAKQILRPVHREWFHLVNPKNKGAIQLSIQFYPAETAKSSLVPDSRFNQRNGCRVTLYQDAHLDDGGLPQIPLKGGYYQNHKCWEEIHQALLEARVFIYICGWSVWTALEMVRGSHSSGSLGEVLKKKAQEGVRVCVMVWDDFTSVDSKIANVFIATSKAGLMGTFDEETNKYFKNTGVHCCLVPRYAKGYSVHGAHAQGNIDQFSALIGHVGSQATFTHHQKSIILDAPSQTSSYRRIIAFLGGLDLTAGRYDTPSHPLFKTLNTVHKDDYYNGIHPTFVKEAGPREPWHDIHCKVEGPIARDVLENFEHRWLKQAPHKNHSNLLDLRIESSILPMEQDVARGWSCQLFRSIDKEAALYVENVEPGILKAYIHQIRRAERFIYIENQYFLGSSMEWEDFDDRTYNIEAKHRIPIELAIKVVSKIRRGERFSLYIVIPMHPEGVPEAAPTQGIVFWQYETVRMMYRKIHEAILKFGPPGAKVTDYMNIYCLGNKEPGPMIKTDGLKEDQALCCKTRRHMVYVHSKMMIVDDDYIIVGSANINQRSMGGDRDTEIAVGCLEDGVNVDGLGRGEVSGFRLSLWAEHLSTYLPVFREPHRLECVNAVNQMAQENWNVYANADDMRPLPHGHLLTYPYTVDSNGKVSATVLYYPDSEKQEAKILGARCAFHMNLLTT